MSSAAATGWRRFSLSELPHMGAGPLPAAAPDPYAAWACLTDFRGFEFPLQEDGWPREINVIVEMHDPAAPTQGCVLQKGTPPMYRDTVGGVLPRFATLRIKVSDLGLLWRCGVYAAWELGAPLRPGDRVGTPAADGAPKPVRPPAARAAVAPFPDGARVAIGIIDHGCAFLHRQFRRGEGTRLHRVWDMGTPAARPWHVPARAGYGRALGSAEIADLLARLRQQGEDENTVYADYSYLRLGDAPKGEPYLQTHGTHVADLAAGRLHPLTGEEDEASRLPVLFAHLPILTVLDSTGGSLAPKVLDALRYMLAEVPEDRALIVNLSYGTQAGPHDGSSLIERAIDELIGLRPGGFMVVEAAGNSRDAKAHVRLELAPGGSEQVTVRLPQSDENDSFVEFWYDRPADPAHAPRFTVTAPDGRTSPVCAAPGQLQLKVGKHPVAALFHYAKVPGGRGSMALLGLAGESRTKPSKKRTPAAKSPKEAPIPRAPAGDWVVTVSLPAGAPALGVDAWIERDTLPRGSERRPISFVLGDGDAQARDGGAGSLANLSTGQRPVVVGACRWSDGEEADYSSWGPTRDGRPKPDVLAPGEEDAALSGLRAAGVRSGDTFRMPGTSVAAPLVARELANHLAASGPPFPRTPDDWRDTLTAVCDSPAGRRLRLTRS